MCRCGETCKFRKLTDKQRITNKCIHGAMNAVYDPKLGFTVSPNCPYCKERTGT